MVGHPCLDQLGQFLAREVVPTRIGRLHTLPRPAQRWNAARLGSTSPGMGTRVRTDVLEAIERIQR
ncbi:MAG: hypothetical protein ACRDTG_07470, partial [Pseudonocardiaceae bacterium]